MHRVQHHAGQPAGLAHLGELSATPLPAAGELRGADAITDRSR